MNNHDPFEKRLGETPPRTIPADWRDKILRECLSPAGEKRDWESCPVARHSEAGVFVALRQWLWPHPAAWAALAAVWVGIIGLSISAGITPVSLARQAAAAPASPEYLAFLREQRALLRSLIGELPPPVTTEQHEVQKPSALWFRREWAAAIG